MSVNGRAWSSLGVESVCHASKHLMSLVTIWVLNSSEFYFLRTYILQNDNQTAIVRRRRLPMICFMCTFHDALLVDGTGRQRLISIIIFTCSRVKTSTLLFFVMRAVSFRDSLLYWRVSDATLSRQEMLCRVTIVLHDASYRMEGRRNQW